uniref:hypothetical protein n=1 Tax=Streptomyces scabiei TaxID=1930 RepID=UPI000E68CB6C|nr:hypothetical protein [Streptomyces scabiei]
MFGLISLRRHQAEIAALNADRDRLRGERDQFAKDRDAFKTAAATAARQLVEADEKPDAVEEHVALRNALADALGADPHLTWPQLLTTARRARQALVECKAEYEAEKKRAGHLDKGGEIGRLKRQNGHLQRRLDDALGLGGKTIAPPWGLK